MVHASGPGSGIMGPDTHRYTLRYAPTAHHRNGAGDGTSARCRRSTPTLGRGARMAAMKPRTGDGPLEVTKEGRGIVMRVPLEGGGRLVVELNAEEATELGNALKAVVG